MRSGLLLRFATLAVWFGLAVTATPGQQSSSSQQTGDAVADAARQTRNQKKTGTATKKVYTNDDFASAPQSQPAAAAPVEGEARAPGATAASAREEKTNPEEDKNSETYWRKRFKTVNGKLATAEKELDILQREADKGQVQYYNDPQKALMQQNNRQEINEKNAKIAAKKKEIESIKQELANLEDELRKAGGDPGWAR